MIAIHKPTLDDYDAVRALVAEVHALHRAARGDVYAADAHFSREYYAALLADENGFPIAAYDGNELIGFASGFIKPPNPNPAMLPHRIAYIDDICVHSRCRGRGIGRLLYNETVRLARERGADTLMLTVWAFNESAIRFYKSLGMTERNINMDMRL